MLEHLLGTASPEVASAAAIAIATDEGLTGRDGEGRRRRSPKGAMSPADALGATPFRAMGYPLDESGELCVDPARTPT